MDDRGAHPGCAPEVATEPAPQKPHHAAVLKVSFAMSIIGMAPIIVLPLVMFLLGHAQA
jgi:hypothetical protein